MPIKILKLKIQEKSLFHLLPEKTSIYEFIALLSALIIEAKSLLSLK